MWRRPEGRKQRLLKLGAGAHPAHSRDLEEQAPDGGDQHWWDRLQIENQQFLKIPRLKTWQDFPSKDN